AKRRGGGGPRVGRFYYGPPPPSCGWSPSPCRGGIVMSELTSKTIADLRRGLGSREFSAREVAEAFNSAVAAAKTLNAYTIETPEDALAAAEAADSGKATGPLAGIPLGIKDLFATE